MEIDKNKLSHGFIIILGTATILLGIFTLIFNPGSHDIVEEGYDYDTRVPNILNDIPRCVVSNL